MDVMDDWEDGPLPPLLSKVQPKNSWDDEGVEDNEVKQSWEDEDEDENTQAPVPKLAVGKSTKKAVSKGSEMKGKVADTTKEAPLHFIQEKLYQQRLVGDLSTESTNEKSLDNFIPKSESDFLKYAELISHKLQPYEHSYYYLCLLKAVMRISMKTLKASDAKEVVSSVVAIANERLKAEREADGRKWKTTAPKKMKVFVEKPEDDASLDAYDVRDDHDDFI